MSLPKALQGNRWTEETARRILPLVVWCAQNGQTITYGQLDRVIVEHGWGHHVMAVKYGYPAGAIGNALIETGIKWEELIPPLNALIVNQETKLPSKGVNYFLERYSQPDKHVDDMTLDEKRAIVEEIHTDIYSYESWTKLLHEYGMKEMQEGFSLSRKKEDDISTPARGGWSNEGESDEHRNLKEIISSNPAIIGLDNETPKGITEYQFSSGDKADVVFKWDSKAIGVEVKSIISNDEDLNRGIFQCVKYQALLRAEQKATLTPPTARAILVTENDLSLSLHNLADILGIKVVIYRLNK